MDLAAYKEKIRDLAESWFREEQHLSTTQRCCISFKPNELSILCVDVLDDALKIQFLEKMKMDDMQSLPLVMKGMIDRYQLTMTPFYWLLGPEDYQLNLIESMPVPENEFHTALTWRIRSLIHYPIDEAVLEYFELPAKKNAPNAPLIGAVTAQKTKLSTIISTLKEAGLNLAKIDIPELAMLKLTALYETDEKSTAFLYFYDKFLILNISNRKTLYFTRRINITFISGNEIDYESIALEIMRYFDFYRSQWRLSSPSRILIAADIGDVHSAAKILTERLMNPVDVYTLHGSVFNDKYKDEVSNKFLLDYGCLLKKGGINA